MSRKSRYVGWFGRLNIPTIDSSEQEEVSLEDFTYSKDSISFKLVRYVSRKVPIRHTTVNYVKYPVEWKNSIRSAVIFKLSKKINLERFCEVDLLNLDIPDEFKITILARLNFIPTWRQKIIDIERLEEEIERMRKKIAEKIDKKMQIELIHSHYDKQVLDINYEISHLKTLPSSKQSFYWRIFGTIFTFGLSWVKFVSLKTASINKELEIKLEKKILEIENAKNIVSTQKDKQVTQENIDIERANQKIWIEIEILKRKLRIVEEKSYQFQKDETGFINLRKALPSITKFETKGVYVIWNKTKDKYYVGQSKDVFKRLFTQHFNNNDVKNIIFAKDWYANDEFFFIVHKLESKDQLDALEKELIEKYNSFRSGYNATGGNK